MSETDLEGSLRARLEQEPDVLAAYLFGSRSRGTAGPLSDVDLAILLDGGARRPDRYPELVAAVADHSRRRCGLC